MPLQHVSERGVDGLGERQGLGAGLGWMLAICLMAGLREKMGYSNVPAPLRGTAIVMLVTGVIAMAFMGFAGMIGMG